MEISKVIVGSSFNMKKAKKVAKIGLQNAKDIPFDTSICLIPSKSKNVPNPVDTTPINDIQNQDSIL